MTMFDRDLRPVHDPATCQREHCGRCRPRGASNAPGIIPNPHDAAPPSRHSIPRDLDPDALADELEQTARKLREAGVKSWGMFHDWTPAPRIPVYDGPDGEQSRSAEEERNRWESVQAGRYWSELTTLVHRIDADSRRLRTLVAIASHPNRKGSVSNAQGCELCAAAGLKQNGQPVPFDHHSNVGERLPRNMFLCQAHYLYVQRHDHAPSTEQTRHWSATGTWKVKA